MEDIINSAISVGSTFISLTSCALLNISGSAIYPKTSYSDLIQLEDKALKVLKEKGWLDVPILIEKLNIDADTSINIMKSLKNKGIIIKQNAI